MVVETVGNRAREGLGAHRDYEISLGFKRAKRGYVTRPPRHYYWSRTSLIGAAGHRVLYQRKLEVWSLGTVARGNAVEYAMTNFRRGVVSFPLKYLLGALTSNFSSWIGRRHSRAFSRCIAGNSGSAGPILWLLSLIKKLAVKHRVGDSGSHPIRVAQIASVQVRKPIVRGQKLGL